MASTPMPMPEVAMARLLDDEVDPPVHERVRWASAVYDELQRLAARIAELETGEVRTEWGVRWPDDGADVEQHLSRENAERVARRETGQLVSRAVRTGPWTEAS